MLKILKKLSLAIPVFAVFLLLININACSKKENLPQPANSENLNSSTIKYSAPDRKSLLTGKKWKMTALIVDPPKPYEFPGPNVTDWYKQMKPCEKDNVLTYYADGYMTDDEGAAKCFKKDPQTITGSWEFNSDQTIITETINSKTVSYEVVKLQNDTLMASYTENYMGTEYIITATFTAQK